MTTVRSLQSTNLRMICFAIFVLFVSLASSLCLTSGCTLNSQCNTCAQAATHTIWQEYDVSFTCNSTTTSCMPNFNSGNASASVIMAACRVRTSSCCVFDDGVAPNQLVCDSKTCLVNNGCIAVGQCDVPSATNYRPVRANCCNSDSGCPATPTLCNPEICISNSCIPTLRFPNCCDGPSQCPSSSSVACLKSACLPDEFHPGFNACQIGIDNQCSCSSNADCDDGSICSTNVCDILTNKCTATYFSSSGGSSCCANDAGAPVTCSTGNVCRNILGCRAETVAVNSSLSFLPTFSCIARNEQDIGCCSASSQCSALQSSSGSPCVAPVCNFADNTCNIQPNYFSNVVNETLPCCKDSIDCEPTGQDGPRCQYLKCNSPLFQATIEQTFFTCALEQLPITCQEDGVIETNVVTTSMAIDGNCSWACGQPNTNIIKLDAKITNPSSGPNFASPLYLYNVTVKVSNFAPLLSGIISSISLLPVSPYQPPTRFLSPALFVITQPHTEAGNTYRQKFSLADPTSMPIYPDEELTVQIIITLRTNATALTAMHVFLEVNPYDICTPTLVAGGIPGTDGTPCNTNADIGNILPRTTAGTANMVISFPGTCSTPCSIIGTTTSSSSLLTTTTTKVTTTTPSPTLTLAPSPAVSAASGVAFYDTNGNGFTNVPPEPVVPNIRINAQSASNASDSYSTLTNAAGQYTFSVVPTTPYYLYVVSSTLPYNYQPTIVVNNNLSPRKNQFDATTLRTITRPSGANYQGLDLGLVVIPPCVRASPPPGPTGQLQLRFNTLETSCIECGSLIKLRSRCSPVKCSGLMTRQFITVEATVSNTAPVTLGFGTLVLRLNSLGVGPLDSDVRPYVCAEALDVNSTNAYVLRNNAVSQSGLASISYGWKSIVTGIDVVTVRAQFVYCAHDAITNFNITAEILSDSCINTIREWNMCKPSIDIRTCQSTLKQAVPPCSGCPPTPSPAPTGPAIGHTVPIESTNLVMLANPYCFEPLCVNSQTFVNLGCQNITEAMAQCSAAVNRGEVLHQVVVVNPPFTSPSEPGSVIVRYQRNAIDDEQLVCGEKFGNRMPVYVIIDSPVQNQTFLVDRHESALHQTVEFTVAFPSIPPSKSLMISLVSFECSAYALNATVTARLVTDRCTDETTCTKQFAQMPSLSDCVRYRSQGCTETIDGVVQSNFGANDSDDDDDEVEDTAAPYIIIAVILLLLIVGFCVVLVVMRRRRNIEIERSNKRLIAARQFNVEEPTQRQQKRSGKIV